MDIDAIYKQYEEYITKCFRIELQKQKDNGIYISHEDEKDLHQHVLYKLVKYLPRYDSAKSTITTYMYNIIKSNVRWKLIDMRGMEGRKPTRESFNNAMLHYDDPDANLPEPAAQSIPLVESLTKEQMQFCNLVAEEGFSHAEAFDRIGVPPDHRKAFLEALHEALGGV